jgi:predicted small metal-binding protein
MRKSLDCRALDNLPDCSVSFAADSEEELMEAVLSHAVEVHLEQDTPRLRARIRESIGELNQPAL